MQRVLAWLQRECGLPEILAVAFCVCLWQGWKRLPPDLEWIGWLIVAAVLFYVIHRMIVHRRTS